MSKRSLPALPATVRSGIHFDLSPRALDLWNPGVVSAADTETDSTISVLDVIGSDWFGEGVTAKRISAALRSIGERDVVVNVNSPGGDFFEGLAIYNMLRQHSANVTVRVLGIAASAASVIAMAGDTIQIGRAGFLMIHNAWAIVMGNRHDLREAADWLEPFDAAAADLYTTRTGLDRDEVAAMLDRETWISGSDAVDKGFADDFLPADQVDTDDEKAAALEQRRAFMKLDAVLAQAGMSRRQRKDLVNKLGAAMPRAGEDRDAEAAVKGGLTDFLSTLRHHVPGHLKD